MRFQYLKHSLQKRVVYHRSQLCEAIIKLWQRDYPYSRIVDSINDSAIAQISKGTDCLSSQKVSGNKFSWIHLKKLDGLGLWGGLIWEGQKKPKLSEIKRGCNKHCPVKLVWPNQAWTEILRITLFFMNILWHKKLGVINIFKANEITIKYTLQKM